MSVPVCVNDFEQIAESKMSAGSWHYFSKGSDQHHTLKDNVQAFKRYRLRPRVLNDVSNVDMTTKVLGSTLRFPVCVAPTALNKLAHPYGESAVAKAAGELDIAFTLSSMASTSIENIHEQAPGTIKWFQLYIFKDRNLTKSLVKRAEQNGFTALVLTVDSPTFGISKSSRERADIELENFKNYGRKLTGSGEVVKGYILDMFDASLDWSDVEWLKSITSLPVVLKGILTGEMAELAVKHKVDGIVVSNHGGRQLDGVPATIDALSEVVKAVNGRIEVYVDGGIRTGTDVLKAIALGAKTVFVGRPVLWALAHNGEEGVKEMLTILKQEFKTAMQLMGCASIANLQNGKDLVVHESYYKASL